MDDFWVYTSVRDEEYLMPFFLRHYQDYADKVIVQDCGSTDRTKEIVRDSGAELIETEPWGMDEKRRVDEAYDMVQKSAGQCRWMACVDVDEFILGDFDEAFQWAEQDQCDLIMNMGYTVVGADPPKDDGQQIYELYCQGVQGGAEKPCIARAGSKFKWSVGKHFVESRGTRVSLSKLVLLHYRYLGVEYTKMRATKNYTNSPDKTTAWACSPEYHGPHSATFVAQSLQRGEYFDLRPKLIRHMEVFDPSELWKEFHNGQRVIVT